MQELLQAAVTSANIVYTTLLVMVVFYWITVLLGALDASSLDFDFDMDVDANVDIDMDTDVDVDADSSGFSVAGALGFFNFGKIPFMILMSILIFSMWIISIVANHYMPGGGAVLFALMLFFPNLAVGLIITKIVSTPLIPVFKDYRSNGVEEIDFIGLVCTLKMSAMIGQISQATVTHDGNPVLVTIQADQKSGALQKGQEVLIIGKTDNLKYFKVKAIEN